MIDTYLQYISTNMIHIAKCSDGEIFRNCTFPGKRYFSEYIKIFDAITNFAGASLDSQLTIIILAILLVIVIVVSAIRIRMAYLAYKSAIARANAEAIARANAEANVGTTMDEFTSNPKNLAYVF